METDNLDELGKTVHDPLPLPPQGASQCRILTAERHDSSSDGRMLAAERHTYFELPEGSVVVRTSPLVYLVDNCGALREWYS